MMTNDLLRKLIQAEIRASGRCDNADVVEELLVRSSRLDADGNVEIINEAGHPRLTFDGGAVRNIDLAEAITELRRTKRVLFEPPAGAEASGASSTAKPWAQMTQNLTQQMLIQRRDPVEAARLKAEAAHADKPPADARPSLTELMHRAKTDPALAERLIRDPRGRRTA